MTMKSRFIFRQDEEKADDNVITRQYLLKSEALMDYYCKEVTIRQQSKNCRRQSG